MSAHSRVPRRTIRHFDDNFGRNVSRPFDMNKDQRNKEKEIKDLISNAKYRSYCIRSHLKYLRDPRRDREINILHANTVHLSHEITSLKLELTNLYLSTHRSRKQCMHGAGCFDRHSCQYKHSDDDKKQFNIRECSDLSVMYEDINRYKKTGEKILECMDGILLLDISVIIMQYVYIRVPRFDFSIVRECIFCDKPCCGLTTHKDHKNLCMITHGPTWAIMVPYSVLESNFCISQNNSSVKMCVNPLSNEYKMLKDDEYCYDPDHCMVIYNTIAVTYNRDHSNVNKPIELRCKECGLTAPPSDLNCVYHLKMLGNVFYDHRGILLHTTCMTKCLSSQFLSECHILPYTTML